MLWNRKNDIPVTNNPSNQKKALISLAYKSDDEFISRLQAYIKEAAEKSSYDLKIYDSKNSETLQLTQVENARSQGENAILINLVTPNIALPILEAAGNMKVVYINRTPSDMGILNENAIYIGSDETIAGKLQGEWLANYFKERGKTEFRYILLQGPPNLPSTVQRTEAVLQELADNGITAIKSAPTIVANYDRNEATAGILPVLRSGVNFDVIISNNDAMALGAIEAFEYLNMDPTKKIIVGIDATEPAVRALLEGKLDMTVFQNAKAQGETAVSALLNMVAGNPITQGTDYQVSADNPYVIWIPFELVTRRSIPKDLYF